MDGVTPERRAELFDKFPAMANVRPIAPVASTQVGAVLRAEELIARVWPGGHNSAVLFDPVLCPPLAERANTAAEAYRDALAAGWLDFDTADTSYEVDEPAEHGALRVWLVDTPHVLIVRDRWHDDRNFYRETRPVEFFGSQVGHDRAMWDQHSDASASTGLGCNVRIAKACDGPTRMLPADRGTMVLLFRCCRECEGLAGQIAANNRRTNVKIAEMELRLGQ